ncbi:hypothetical protein ACDW_45160 (plasmid) [Acidovorax sp. DW039]|nr:hypothetical protein ACDW_45160 [Acidovorax sp. DW039]
MALVMLGTNKNAAAQSALDGFAPNVNNGVSSLTVQSGGKVRVGGFFTNIDGQPRNYVARLNIDGAVDSSFNPDVNSTVSSLVLLPDGKMLVGGLSPPSAGKCATNKSF